MIDVVQDFVTNVVEEEGVVHWWVAHCIISAVVASMESEFLDLAILRVAESHLLSLHLDDVLGSFIDLLVVEGTDSHCDLEAISHPISIT